MVFDRSICHIPGGTLVEENTLRCKGDLIFSDRCHIQKNVITEGRIFIGERAEIEGDLISIGDIRIDKGTRVNGNITGDMDIFIGERCIIAGTLVVGKNMDIGEGVQIDPKAIDSKGRINIRNPISVLIYIFLYLLDLIKKDDDNEVETFLKELEGGGEEEMLISKDFTYFPRGSRISKDRVFIPGDMKVGPSSHIVGGLETTGDLEIEKEGQVFGDIVAKGNVYIGENSVINGSIKSGRDIIVHHAARIGGDLRGRSISTTSDTIIEGTLRGETGIRIVPETGTHLESSEPVDDQLAGLSDLLDASG